MEQGAGMCTQKHYLICFFADGPFTALGESLLKGFFIVSQAIFKCHLRASLPTVGVGPGTC